VELAENIEQIDNFENKNGKLSDLLQKINVEGISNI